MAKRRYICLDVGEKRIGVAEADDQVQIAIARETILVDGNEVIEIKRRIVSHEITDLVIGYPRNQSGATTAQTQYVETFAKQFDDIDADIHFQDESVTSVLAEQRLKAIGKPYEKGDIDAVAACIILEDYLTEVAR